MPNRILHERICVSSTLAQLSGDEERLFYRLIVQCDDFGRFDGRVSVIRARCFPLQLDLVTDAWITAWLARLVEVGLVARYESDGQPFVQLTTWTRYQYPRAKHSKFPDPTNGLHSPAEASAGMCKQTPADSLVTGTGNVNEERRTKNEERKRSTPLPPPEEGEVNGLTPDDCQLWKRALDLLPSMTAGNREQVNQLEPLCRAADGGLRLRAPPGQGMKRFRAQIARALADAGDGMSKYVQIVEK